MHWKKKSKYLLDSETPDEIAYGPYRLVLSSEIVSSACYLLKFHKLVSVVNLSAINKLVSQGGYLIISCVVYFRYPSLLYVTSESPSFGYSFFEVGSPYR